MNYLLLGPEEGEKNEWLKREKERVLKEHPDAEIHSFYTGDDDGAAVSAVMSQPSLFSSFRYAVIRQYEARTGKDSITDAIISFLRSGQSDAELVIVSSEKSEVRISKEILSRIPKENRLMFWEMFDSKKREWIAGAFRKEGFSIDAEGIEEILFSTENNTADMKNLVNSLSLYFHAVKPDKKAITAEDIEQYAVKTRGEDGYTLFAAIADGDLEHAILIMKTLEETDSYAAVRAFSIITQRFRLLESCLQMRKQGLSMDMIAKDASCLSPYPAAFMQKGLKAREKTVFSKAMSIYSHEDASRIVRYLGRMDSTIKNASAEMHMLVFTDILYTIIRYKGRESGIDVYGKGVDIIL